MIKPVLININDLKLNDNNPRFIKDDKFKKLKKSIQDFPKMMELRPIVIDENNVILGGNMRFRACKDLNLKEVRTVKVEDLTEDQKKEFIIKDNVGFGEWNMEDLANEWSDLPLVEWWLDLPEFDLEVLGDDFSLPDWEKWEIETITFTLHREQNENLKKAIEKSKKMGDFGETWNHNLNWNALARIVEIFLTQNN